MLPFGIGIPEVLVILIVVLLVVGPQKLPELAKTLGKGLKSAQRAGQELRNAMDVSEPMRQARDDWRREFQFDDEQYQHDDFHDAHADLDQVQTDDNREQVDSEVGEATPPPVGLPNTVSRGDSPGRFASAAN